MMNIQNEVQKIHNQYGMNEKANYKIQLLCEQYAKEYHDSEVKKLNLHSVSNCKNFDEIDGCKCKECGYIWNPYETEHFNFTSCEMCGSDNVDADF